MLKKKDIDLLQELILDSRQSKRQLAKKVSYTKETVSNKIHQFEKTGLIKNYSLKFNYSILGLKEYNIFCKFKNFLQKDHDILFNFLNNHPQTTWVGKCFGSFDCKISFLAKNDNLANLFVKELYDNFSQVLSKLDLLVVLDKYKFPTNYFISTLFNRKVNFENKSISKENSIHDLSLEEKNIIFTLGQNPQLSYAQIANDLNLKVETVLYKIKKLESSGILNGFSAVIDGNKLNKIWGIGLFLFKPNKISQIKKKLEKNPSVSSYVESLGSWNLSVTFFASSLDSLYEEYNRLRVLFGEDILDSEFVFILDFYKYPKIPKCILM